MPFPEFFLLVFYLKRSMVKVQLGAVNFVMLFTNFAPPSFPSFQLLEIHI